MMTTYPDPNSEEFTDLYTRTVISYAAGDILVTVDCLTRLLGESGVGLFTAAIKWGRRIVSFVGVENIGTAVGLWEAGKQNFAPSNLVLLSEFLSACSVGKFVPLRAIWNSIPDTDALIPFISALLDIYVVLECGMAQIAMNN